MIPHNMNAISNSRFQYGRLFFILAAIYYASVYAPIGYTSGPGLDPSFVWAANALPDYGLEVGRDLIHVWGPWGWLFYPGAIHHHLVVFWVWTAAFNLLLAGVVWSMAGQERDYWPAGMLLLVCSYFFKIQWLETQIYTLLLVLYLWDYRKRRWWILATAGVFSAVYFYVKFNLTVSLTLLFLAHLVLSGRLRRPRSSDLAAMAVFPVGVLCGGLWNFSSWASFRNWLVWSFQIAAGNSEAMSTPAAGLELALAFLALVVLATLALVLWRRLGLGPALFWAGLVLVVFYFEFKHGLVRADRHVLAFFRMVPILAASAWFLNRSRAVGLLTVAAVVIGLAGPSVKYEPERVKIPFQKLVAGPAAWHFYQQNWNQVPYSKVAPEDVLTTEELDLIGTRPVEVAPFDLSQVRDHGLNWRPSPFFQYFLARTELTDQVNAAHLKGPEAADFLLWTWTPFDECHPLYIAPATHLAILEQYHLLRQTGSRLLFEKGQGLVLKRRALGQVEAAWGEPIPIPAGEGIILARMHFKYGPLGKLLKALFWVPPIYIKFNDQLVYRLVPATAGDGLMVGNFPTNVDQFTYWLKTGQPASTCHRGGAFTIEPQAGRLYFSGNLTVEFEALMAGQDVQGNGDYDHE